ncbi:MAG: phosphocholine cytidylyltransferase family protein [archaeon]
MSTKAVLLAAGRGTRLLPLTENLPKTLLEVRGKPIIEHILDRVVWANVSEIIIAVGHCADKIKKRIGDNYKGTPVKYVNNPKYDVTNSTYSLWLAREVVGDDFLVINADTLFSRNIAKYMIDGDADIALAIDDSMQGELPEEAMKVTIENGLIKDASKQIPPEKTHGDAIGVYRFRGAGVKVLYAELARLVESKVLDQLFTYAVRSLMGGFDVYPISTRGLSWIEVDDHNDLKKAEEVMDSIMSEER